LRAWLIALVFLVGVTTLPGNASASSPAPSNVGIRLVPAPGAPVTDPLARSYVVARLPPGSVLRRRVEIDNNTSGAVNVSVYPAAAGLVRGTFAFAPGHAGNDLSGWTSVSHDLLRLAPGTEAFDTVTVRVPRNAYSGLRYAVVWAQISTPPTAGGVTLVNRVGVRMYLSIGPGGAPVPNFTVGSLHAQRSSAGRPLVVAHVHNTGHSTLDIGGSLTLSNGPDGLRAGPFAVTMAPILAPGASEPVITRLASSLPRGPWRADLRLTSGSLQRSAVAKITFPLNPSAATPPPAAGISTLNIILMVMLALLAITALILLVSRRRQRRLQLS
jgi:hypothetical protein